MNVQAISNERQSLRSLALNSNAEPMHRHLALVRLKQGNAEAIHAKCLQILHDAR